MVWCPSCEEEVEVDYNESAAMTCCFNCGRVLEDTAFSSDVTFMKGADGEGELVGQFVGERGEVRGLQRMAGGKVWSMRGDSHEVSLSKGRSELSAMIDHFVIRPGQDCLEASHRLYRLAVQAGFTKGRMVPQVAACCLYIICRQEAKPFMLIDLSDLLQVNVYKLGAVYLQLTKLLRIEDHPSLTQPIDPSLYIHRFVEKLEVPHATAQRVANTALRLVGQMKRDWMQTGRRPAGICGAALWMACHMHGIHKTKADVMGVVHVGWATLDKRVREFSANAAAGLTLKEFEAAAAAAEEEQEALLLELAKAQEQARLTGAAAPAALQLPRRPLLPGPGGEGEEGGDGEGDAEQQGEEQQQQLAALTVCEHLAEGAAPHAAMGMCHDCFKHFLQTTGGIWGEAANPPAFRAAEERAAALEAKQQQQQLEAGPAPIGLLMPPPGHGTDEEIMTEMALEQQRQDQLQQQQLQQQRATAAAVAAAAFGGRGSKSGVSFTRGRGRGRGRPRKGALPGELGLDPTAAAAAGGATAGGSGDGEDDVALQVAELDTALHALHDAVCHPGEAQQQQQQQQQQAAADGTAAAPAAAAPGGGEAAEDGSAAADEQEEQQQQQKDSSSEFGSSLLGYGRAYVLARQQQQRQQQQQDLAAKRRRLNESQQQGGSSQPAPGTPSQRGVAAAGRAGSGGDDDAFAAALAQTATDGLGVPLGAAAAGLLQREVAVGGGGAGGSASEAEPGAAAGGDVDGAEGGEGQQQQQQQQQQDGEAGGKDADRSGNGDGSQHDSDTDLEAVDDDEISSYMRPPAEVKLKEMLWNSINKDWIAAQELKKANQEAAEAAAAEARRVAAENEAAVAGSAARAAAAAGEEGEGQAEQLMDGVATAGEGAAAAGTAAAGGVGGKKPRARPGPKKGSGSKRPAMMPEADSVHAAARMNVAANKKLSDKINYKVLDDLFEATRGAAAGRSSSCGSAGPDAGGDELGLFAATKAAEQQRRAAAESQEAARYRQQLEAETRRRGGSGLGFSLDMDQEAAAPAKAGGGRLAGLGGSGARPGGSRLGSLRR